MKHENEVVDSGLVMRIICGLLTVAGVVVFASNILTVISGESIDWTLALMSIGMLYGIFLFGSYALTGKLPIKTKQQ